MWKERDVSQTAAAQTQMERKEEKQRLIYMLLDTPFPDTHISRPVFFLTHTFQSPPIYVQTLRSKSLSAASLLIYVAYYTLFDTFWTPGRKLIIETCVVWPSCPVECWMRAKRERYTLELHAPTPSQHLFRPPLAARNTLASLLIRSLCNNRKSVFFSEASLIDGRKLS